MSCQRAEIDLECCEGATFNKSFCWKSGDPAVGVDLTGYSAEMQVRATMKATTTIFDLNTTSGTIIIEDQTETPGKYTILIPDDMTEDITNHVEINGVYDLKLISPEPYTVTKLQQFGVFTIYPSVTR